MKKLSGLIVSGALFAGCVVVILYVGFGSRYVTADRAILAYKLGALILSIAVCLAFACGQIAKRNPDLGQTLYVAAIGVNFAGFSICKIGSDANSISQGWWFQNGPSLGMTLFVVASGILWSSNRTAFR